MKEEYRGHKYKGTFRVRLTEPVIADPADERRSLFEHNVLAWAVVVKGITPRLSTTGLPEQILAVAKGERTGEEWLSYAHLLAIGMRQIERHLQFLKDVGFRNPAIADAATKFFDACNTAVVRDLRDLLEHQADYIAGEGRKPHLVVDLRQPVSFGGDSTGSEELVWVSVFGRQYRVDPIVRAVEALEGALREGRKPLQEGGDAMTTVTLPVPGKPGLTSSFTEEHARELLAGLLTREKNSDAHRTVVNLLRQALQQRERL